MRVRWSREFCSCFWTSLSLKILKIGSVSVCWQRNSLQTWHCFGFNLFDKNMKKIHILYTFGFYLFKKNIRMSFQHFTYIQGHPFHTITILLKQHKQQQQICRLKNQCTNSWPCTCIRWQFQSTYSKQKKINVRSYPSYIITDPAGNPTVNIFQISSYYLHPSYLFTNNLC